MATKFHPEVRKQLRNMMEKTFTAFFTSMQSESFSEPDSAETISILLEAIADASSIMVADHHDREALLNTFALDILDRTKD